MHKYYSLDTSLNMTDVAECPVDKLLCCAQEDRKIHAVYEHSSPPQRKQKLGHSEQTCRLANLDL